MARDRYAPAPVRDHPDITLRYDVAQTIRFGIGRLSEDRTDIESEGGRLLATIEQDPCRPAARQQPREALGCNRCAVDLVVGFSGDVRLSEQEFDWVCLVVLVYLAKLSQLHHDALVGAKKAEALALRGSAQRSNDSSYARSLPLVSPR